MKRFLGAVLMALNLCVFALPAAELGEVGIRTNGKAIEVELPLTAVTSKVRVKLRAEDGSGQPVAPTRTRLDRRCYLEWQIGYDTPDRNAPSVRTNIVFRRRGETKYGHELSAMLLEARRLGLLTTNALIQLRDSLARQKNPLEEQERVALERDPGAEKLPGGFERFVEKSPRYTLQTPHGGIEIHLKEKQRAVGRQAMLYVCLPMDSVRRLDGTPRPATPAQSKERVLYRFDAENLDFLLDIVRAFGLASRQHNADLRTILDRIIAE